MGEVHLVTGKGSFDHIRSADDGALNALQFGRGLMILSGCGCELADATTAVLAPGALLVEGRFVRVEGSVEVPLQSGAPGASRIDLIALRYAMGAEDGVETVTVEAIPGAPVSGTPSDPPYTAGSVLDGALAADYPLYRVRVAGTEVGAPEPLAGRVERYGVGDVYLSGAEANPAQAFGGAWEELSTHMLLGVHAYKRTS